MTPSLSIDWNIPPCPSAASLICPFSFNRIFPSVLSIGNLPCLKNVTQLSGYPKKSCSLKKFSVASLFSSLVIIYQGISTPYLLLASFKVSQSISNIDLCVSNPKSYVPLGPVCPSLVPCPPAIVTTANFPALIFSVPIFSYFAYSSLDNLDLSTKSIGSIFDSEKSFSFLLASYNFSICPKSIVRISFKKSCFSFSPGCLLYPSNSCSWPYFLSICSTCFNFSSIFILLCHIFSRLRPR